MTYDDPRIPSGLSLEDGIAFSRPNKPFLVIGREMTI